MALRDLLRFLAAGWMLSAGAASAAEAPTKRAPPAPAPSAAQLMAEHWQAEALKQGHVICTNPNHHHQISAQMHLLVEDSEADDRGRSGR